MVFQFVAGLIGGLGIGSVLSTVQTRILRGTRLNDPVELLQSASYADALRLGYLTETQYLQYMAEMGFSGNQAKIYYANTRQFLSKEDASIRRIAKSFETVFDHHTGQPNTAVDDSAFDGIKSEYCRAMYKIGYDNSESVKLFESLRPVPTFSILLEWLAKEVFEPNVRATFQLDEDYPVIWNDLMKALGVPEFERQSYWAAHWNHPSPGQIGDMFTRFRADRTDYSNEDLAAAGTNFDAVKMTKADFTEALKLHEIAPYWRDRIIATSYRPLPFTALQSAFVYNLKDNNWIKGRLRDYGYSDGNADFLISMWTRKFPYASKNPIDANVLLRFERGELTRNNADTILENAGISVTARNYLLDIANDKKRIRRENEHIKSLRKLYRSENMTVQQLKAKAIELGIETLRADEIVAIISSGDLGLFTRIRFRDIRTGYKNGNITRDEAIAKLNSLRIYDDDLDFFLSVYAP